ncbi:Acb2/Tad1 domain-containing protein [Roseiconus lacunae]|uniref:Acb2/Tad1 domain-containing protein n=1 Tax=Roseiconus lacunae TaxID=2605694 RepID=UPI00190F520B|nr:hypothetical protein [Roseiconus lacunae]
MYDVDNNFTYHSPTAGQVAKFAAIRSKGKELAELLLESCPDSRERSSALSRIEEAIFWANASIARHPDPVARHWAHTTLDPRSAAPRLGDPNEPLPGNHQDRVFASDELPDDTDDQSGE